MRSSWVGGTIVSSTYSLTTTTVIYYGIRFLPIGYPRFFASLPILLLNIYVPWVFDPSTHMLGTAILFCVITWIKSFRLILFCFGIGPLSQTWVTARFARFLVILTIPVHIKVIDQTKGLSQRTVPGKEVTDPHSNHVPDPPKAPAPGPSQHRTFSRMWGFFEGEAWPQLIARATAKTVVMVLVMASYNYRSVIPPFVIHVFYALNLYLFVTIVLEFLGVIATVVGGVQIEPFFDRPYISSSFVELWAKRWNILVSTVLRESVYEPTMTLLLGRAPRQRQLKGRTMDKIRQVAGPSESNVEQARERLAETDVAEASGVRRRAQGNLDGRNVGEGAGWERGKGGGVGNRGEKGERETMVVERGSVQRELGAARVVAALATFFVSGVMHELAVYYMVFRVTGEMTLFFSLHGVFVVCERFLGVRMSRAGEDQRFGVHKSLKILFTLGLTLVTAEYLFWAPLIRYEADIEVLRELESVGKGIVKLVLP